MGRGGKGDKRVSDSQRTSFQTFIKTELLHTVFGYLNVQVVSFGEKMINRMTFNVSAFYKEKMEGKRNICSNLLGQGAFCLLFHLGLFVFLFLRHGWAIQNHHPAVSSSQLYGSEPYVS